MADVQTRINADYDSWAGDYENQPTHAIAAEAIPLWLALVHEALPLDHSHQVLDLGAGTGVFSRVAALGGAHVTALEPSQAMIDQSPPGNIRFICGDAHDGTLFAPASFDLILSRQAACYFHDPLTVFAHCHRWLKPHGRLLIVDGLWQRWADEGLVDELPLSCLQTRATLAYFIAKSGFAIVVNRFLSEIDGPDSRSRYAIVAERL